MLPLTLSLLCAGILPGSSEATATGLSYLYQPAFCMDYELRQPAEPYHPQPGNRPGMRILPPVPLSVRGELSNTIVYG